MTPKEQLLKELEGLSEPLVSQVLDFLMFLKTKDQHHTAEGPAAKATLTKADRHSTSTPQSADLPVIQTIYTDGACSGNPGPGGWGTVLYLADGSVHEMGGGDRRTTNNRMEMQAAIVGLQLLVATEQTTPVELFTDSEYVKKGITEWLAGWKRRGWQTAAKKPVLNQDLWQQLDEVNQESTRLMGAPIKWTYVRGHTGNEGNERCDEIARAFSSNQPIELTQHPALLTIEPQPGSR